MRCDSQASPISELIYGVAGGEDLSDSYFEGLAPTARRWGGNPTSTYNWQLGNAWNTGSDWFFRNVPAPTATDFLSDNRRRGMKSALTVPLLGWVAKDTVSSSFPVAEDGAQAASDPSGAGNGVNPTGRWLPPGPPTRTSVSAPPEFIGDWVRSMRARDRVRGDRSVDQYILDNEPALWNVTHRDLHPRAVSYDELLQRTISYATQIRRADPDATIAGPAEWGFPNYFTSAVDSDSRWSRLLQADRWAHRHQPLLPWYLQQLRQYRERTGERLLDVVDVHYYPLAPGVWGNGGTDAAAAALRLRATRSLWDPTYVDESWLHDTVRLLPRLHEWIAQTDPGLGISIGEWNFGGERDVSGGLAVAEVLGRLGQQGVTSAFYWTYPPENSPAYWGFRAYRNYDGRGGHFLSWSIPTTSGDGASLFASRNQRGDQLVLVALNLKPQVVLHATLEVGTCGTVVAQRVFQATRAQAALTEQRATEPAPAKGSAVADCSECVGPDSGAVLPPYSISVFDLRVMPAAPTPTW